MATMTEGGSITVEKFTAADVPAFVAEEVEEIPQPDTGADVLPIDGGRVVL